MKNYISHHPWKIVENGFHAEENEVTESLMSLGNGRMGQRGNFEETYSGATLQGNYIAGVWFPDKTKVGWWKNGYPDYFAKVINATN
jgi:maltose phosphorylase